MQDPKFNFHSKEIKRRGAGTEGEQRPTLFSESVRPRHLMAAQLRHCGSEGNSFCQDFWADIIYIYFYLDLTGSQQNGEIGLQPDKNQHMEAAKRSLPLGNSNYWLQCVLLVRTEGKTRRLRATS